MKYFAYFLVFVFLDSIRVCFGQTTEKTDTSSILELIEKSRSIRDSQPQQSLKLAHDALDKSQQTGYSKGIALAYARMGRWYFGNNIDSSIFFALKSLNAADEEILPDSRADMHLLLAEAYDEQGRTDSSAYYYYLLGDEAESGKITKPAFMVEIYTKLTIFWINLLEVNYKDEKIGNTIRGYIQKAKQVSLTMPDTADALSSMSFLQGIYYHGIHEYDSARYFYLEFLRTREKIKKLNVLRKISTLTNIAGTYLDQNRPAEAIPYIEQVKQLGNDTAQKKYLSFFMAFVGLQEGKALYQLKKYPAAVQVLEESLDQLKTTGAHMRNEIVDAYKNLGDSYEAMGNYQQALANKNTYILLNDSLFRKEKLDMISRQEIRSRIAEKDKELVQQQLTIAEVRNKVRNKNVVIGSIITLLLVLALLLVSWRRRNMHKQKIQQQKIENLQQKIKIERLNATIAGEEKERTRIARELHDGVGGLITAAKMNFEIIKKDSGKSDSHEYQQVLQLLQEASSELRHAASNLMPEILFKQGLVKAVQLFCDQVSAKSDTRISFQSFGDKKLIDHAFELSIYRIIQELIHNIVKHSRAQNALVQLNFHPDGGMNITVEDDGIGINRTSVTRVATGMGLKNIQDRTKEMGGKLDIKSGDGEGTSVYIEFESP